MENYEKLSFTFKKMLKRIKIMRLRLKELTKMINENTNKSFINSDENEEIRTESEYLCISKAYLNVDIKRTVIMLKIYLYRQKIEIKNSINEITTTSSVDENNGFGETNNSNEKSTSTISDKIDEQYKKSMENLFISLNFEEK